jgi:hypothetical protein
MSENIATFWFIMYLSLNFSLVSQPAYPLSRYNYGSHGPWNAYKLQARGILNNSGLTGAKRDFVTLLLHSAPMYGPIGC